MSDRINYPFGSGPHAGGAGPHPRGNQKTVTSRRRLADGMFFVFFSGRVAVLFYTVPSTVTTVSPGVSAHSPVSVWVKVAAGTVIAPETVANAPVASS